MTIHACRNYQWLLRTLQSIQITTLCLVRIFAGQLPATLRPSDRLSVWDLSQDHKVFQRMPTVYGVRIKCVEVVLQHKENWGYFIGIGPWTFALRPHALGISGSLFSHTGIAPCALGSTFFIWQQTDIMNEPCLNKLEFCLLVYANNKFGDHALYLRRCRRLVDWFGSNITIRTSHLDMVTNDIVANMMTDAIDGVMHDIIWFRSRRHLDMVTDDIVANSHIYMCIYINYWQRDLIYDAWQLMVFRNIGTRPIGKHTCVIAMQSLIASSYVNKQRHIYIYYSVTSGRT